MKNTIYIFISILVFIFACNKYYEKEESPYPPRNNNLIKNQIYLGTSSTKSNFWQIENTNEGNLFYSATLNSSDVNYDVIIGNQTNNESYFNEVVGKIKTNGNILLEKHPGFNIQRILTFSQASNEFENGLIIVGYFGNPRKAKILIYDNELNTSINFTHSDSDIWFNDIIFKSQNNNEFSFIVVGGISINNINYPYIAVIIVDTENKLISVLNSKIFNDFPNYTYYNIVKSDDGLSYFCSTGYKSNDLETSFSVIALSLSYVNLWKKDINYHNEECWHGLNSLAFYQNKIFIAGTTYDPDKGETGNDGLWTSGFVTCLDINGNKIWATKVLKSLYSESFNSLVVSNSYVYGVGYHSAFISKKSKDSWDDAYSYGNAYIAKFDINTGKLIQDFTFGDINFQSGFYNIKFIEDKIYAVGLSERIYANGNYNAWFLELQGSINFDIIID